MISDPMRAELFRFDPTVPIERAFTPPASWYQRPEFLELERERVFRKTWQARGSCGRCGRASMRWRIPV